MSARVTAVVLAAGRGQRLGEDKALMTLGREPAVRTVVRRCKEGSCDDVIVVRRRGADELPADLRVRVLEVETDEMIESLRAAVRALADDAPDGVLVFPIDYAMVGGNAVAALTAAVGAAVSGEPAVVLPICRGRPGHPLGLTWSVAVEVLDARAAGTLRDVIRRDPGRVRTVEVEDGWVLRDIDRPEDLRAARGHLANLGAATELMARHRSRRTYLPDPVSEAQLRWLVDSARHASTSSFIQACSVVVVRDAERKNRAATLCADQAHIRQAPVFLAICADLHRLGAACRDRDAEFRPDSLEVFVQATVDAALVGQNLQLAAESEGLGSCMIGAARNHPVELAELLGLPPHVYVVFGMTLGWPADDPVPRDRITIDAVLHFEEYDARPTAVWLEDADQRMRAWARAVNAKLPPAARPVDERRGWTDRMARSFGGVRPPKSREHLLEDLRRLGFGIRGGEDTG